MGEAVLRERIPEAAAAGRREEELVSSLAFSRSFPVREEAQPMARENKRSQNTAFSGTCFRGVRVFMMPFLRKKFL